MKKLALLAIGLMAMSLDAGLGCCDGRYFGGVEATFLVPSTSDLYFVIRGKENTTSSDVPRGDLLAVRPDFTTGFTAWIGRQLCDPCYDVQFSWQYLHSNDSRKVSVSGDTDVLWLTKVHPSSGFEGEFYNGFARSRPRFDFDAADLELGYTKECGCNLQMRLSGSVRYAMVGYRNQYYYQGREGGPTGDFAYSNWNEHSWAWGIGPRIGADLRYTLCGCLGLRAVAGAALLAGEIRSSVRNQSDEGGTNFQDMRASAETVYNTMPAVEAKLGLDYVRPCGCKTVHVGAGYQVARYFSAVQRSTFCCDDAEGVYVMTSTHLDLTGFYVGAGIQF